MLNIIQVLVLLAFIFTPIAVVTTIWGVMYDIKKRGWKLFAAVLNGIAMVLWLVLATVEFSAALVFLILVLAILFAAQLRGYVKLGKNQPDAS